MILLVGGASQLFAQMPGAKQHVQVEKATLGYDRIVRKSIGRMEAIDSVDVKAPVEGVIQPMYYTANDFVCPTWRYTDKLFIALFDRFDRLAYFKEGDTVKKGQVLFKIDPVRYQAVVQQREAQLEQIQAQIIYAKNRYARLKRLAGQNATAKEEEESAYTKLKELEAAEKEAEANLAKARKDLADCTVKAEITGRIGRINLSAGNYITRGETLVSIKQMDPIYVRFPLSQYDVNGIFSGPQGISAVADVRLTLANGRRYEYPGEIAIVDNILTGDSDTYTLWAKFENPGQVLTPRGIGALNVSLTATTQVCMVPLTAVHYDENGAYIYTVDETGKVARAEATVGSIQGRLQAVYSGITPGQTVITDGAHKIRVGDTVVAVEAIHEDTAEQNNKTVTEATPIVVTTTKVTTMQDPTVFKCHGAHIEAINKVDFRPLVHGILLQQPAKKGEAGPSQEGQPVTAGSVLFRIDPTRYQAEVDAVKAQVERLEASIADAKAKYTRQQELLKRNATSPDIAESYKATLDELIAKKKAAEAMLVIAEDDLERCTMKAPVNGRIGRVFFSEGNYISDIKAPLATLVQISPIYVRFFMSENEILSAYGSATNLKEQADVTLVTAKGTVHPEIGSVHFADNIIKTATDTQNLWAVFNNEGGQLTPGGIVTIKITRKSHIRVPAVENAAILTDTGGKYVYTAKHGRAVMTRVLCGTTDPQTGLTPIFRGLKEGDVVITGPLAEIEEGSKIEVEQTANK